MSMPKPKWFDYAVWDYSDKEYPILKGFKKNTPKELIEQYKKEREEYLKAVEEGIVP